MLIKSLMGYFADIARGGLWMDPVLPETYADLHITNAPMANTRITIDISGSSVAVSGLPEGMLFHHRTRPRAADLMEQAGFPKMTQPISFSSRPCRRPDRA